MRNLIFISLILFGFSSVANSYSEKALEKAIKDGDWQNTTALLHQFFNERGIAASDSLMWYPQPATTLINFYNNSRHTPGIVVSKFPVKDSIWEYWQNWSTLLTNGNWDYKKSFKNKKQAFMQAKYNVLMLLSHEFGHHLAHRHRVYKETLSCNEYLADLVSIALIESFSDKSCLSKLQEQYVVLCEQINKAVAEKDRFSVLVESNYQNCSLMDVQYSSDTVQMAQYASAYFARRIAFHNFNTLSTSQIIDSFYRLKQLNWYKMHPKAKSALKVQDLGVSNFEYDYKTELKRSMIKWRRGRNVYNETGGYAFDSSGRLLHWSGLWPSTAEGNAVIELQYVQGNPAYRWYTESKQLISSDVDRRSLVVKQADENIGLLVATKNKDSYCFGFYRSIGATMLKKVNTDINLGSGNFQMLDYNDSTLTMIYSKRRISLYTDAMFKFYKLNYNYITKAIEETHLADLSSAEMLSTHWFAALSKKQELDININRYILSYRDGKWTTIVGNGVYGSNIDYKEFHPIRAMQHINGNLVLLEEFKGLSSYHKPHLKLKTIIKE